MTEKDEFNQYLADESSKVDKDKLSIEVPADPTPLNSEMIPSGLDPMGRIEMRGQAYRGLAGGQTPWWILLSGWFVFGFFAAVAAHAAIKNASLALWILLVIASIPLLILARGTIAKLSTRDRAE
jgi:hypothetical protein